MAALVFGSSGFSHLKLPRQRAKSIGMSVGFIIFLGAAELAGALGLAFGVLTQCHRTYCRDDGRNLHEGCKVEDWILGRESIRLAL